MKNVKLVVLIILTFMTFFNFINFSVFSETIYTLDEGSVSPARNGHREYYDYVSSLQSIKYSIYLKWEFNTIDANGDHRDSPRFKIFITKKDGSVSEHSLVDGRGSFSGVLLIPPESTIRAQAFSGEKRSWHRDHWRYYGYGFSFKLTYGLDEQAPNIPSTLQITSLDLGVIKDDTFYTNSPLTISWKKVDDNASYFSNRPILSGMKEYIIEDSNVSSPVDVINQIITVPHSPDLIEYSKTVMLPYQGLHYIRLRARDNAIDHVNHIGNISLPSQEIKVLYDTTAPLIPEQPSVTNERVSPNQITWVWNQSDDGVNGSGINGYKVYVASINNNTIENIISDWGYSTNNQFTHDVENGKTYICKVKAVDLAKNESLESPEGRVIVDNFVPEVILPKYPLQLNGEEVTFHWEPITTDYSGVQQYQVALTTTTDEPTDWDTVTSVTNGRWEKKFTLNSLHNTYYAWVRGVDLIGNIGDWTRTGSFPEFYVIGPADNINTNQLSPDFGIQKHSSASGKDLRYKVYYQKTGGTPQEYPGSFSDEGSYQWYIEVYEYLNGIKQEDSKQISKEYTLHIDRTSPTGTFGVSSVDGWKDYTQIPTNNTNIHLAGIKASLNDAGIVNSGIKGIYLWNKEIQTLGETPSELTPPSGATYIEIEKLPVNGNVEWRLPDQDGNYRINMIVEDGAGNYSDLIYRDITLDRIAPGAPNNFGHSHRVENNIQYLKYTWQANVSENDIFKVSYILPDGTEKTVNDPVLPLQVGDIYTGSFEMNVTQTKTGPNEPIKLKVIAVDPAGNEAEVVCENVYTLAQPGTLTNFDEDYYYVNNQYKARFSYNIEGGVAAGQYLEVSTNPEFIETETEKNRKIEPVGDKFIVDNLDGHGTYYYRLVAINNSIPQDSSDRNIVNFDPYRVPNYGPVFPDESLQFQPRPNSYATCTVKFSFPEATDPNGDAIQSYIVKYAVGEIDDPNSSAFLKINPDQTGAFSLTLDKSAHGSKYSWFVEAVDSQGGKTFSNVYYFTLDAIEPNLTLETPARPFTNQRQLTVTVSDDLSGINQVTYSIIGKDNNPIGDPATVSLVNGVGLINLPEGNYHLKVTATDVAGNNKSQDLNNLIVDYTGPQISNLIINLIETGDSFISSGTIPVWLTAIENGVENSGIKGVRYWLTDQAGMPSNDGQYIALSHGLEDFAFTLTIPEGKENGELYYLALAVYDRANNQSETYRLTKPILLDTTPPQLSLTVEGLIAGGSGYYLNDLIKLNVSLEAVDDETGHTETLAILNDGGTQASGWDQWETIKNSQLIPGKKYRIAAKGVNGAGLETQVQSQLFTFDNSKPEVEVIQEPQAELATGETASYIFRANDSETAIVAYRLAIGTAEQETALTRLITENTNGWYEVRTNSEQLNLRIEIPSIDDGKYQAVVEVTNAAGLSERIDAGTIIINNKRERITVSDQGPYTLFTDQLTGWWEYHGADTPQGYRYRIYRIEGANKSTVVDWTETNEREVTVKNLDLQTGAIYGFEAQAVFTGNRTITGFSPGVLVDGTKPEIIKYNAPLYATPWNIGFSWEAKDDESGVKRVLAALGTDFQRTDVTKGWVEINGFEAQLSCDANGEPLVFDLEANNRYYLTLRVINGAGAAVEAISAATIIDETPPPVPVVTDQGAYINTSADQPLEANWIWSETDAESGVAYQWTILKYGEKVTADTIWHDSEAERKITLYMDQTALPDEDNAPRYEDGKWYFRRIHGATYYFAVKAVNGAGLTSIGYSNGIMVDQTAPFIPKVILMEAVNLGNAEAPEVNYITNLNGLGLWIDSLDPESPIDQYRFAWNIPEKVDETERLIINSREQNVQIVLTDEILNQNPTFVEGNINIFASECSNEAILTSATGYSTGVILDTGAPKIVNVRGCVYGNNLLFDWEVVASTSPVVQYQYQLTPDTGKDHPNPELWLAAPDLSRRLVLDAQNIPDGKYCLLVRACNAAGTYSRREGELNELGVSPTIIIDRNSPAMLENEFRYPLYGHDKIAGVHLKAEDKNPKTGAPGSGIHSYQYALGTRSNPFQFTNGWQDVPIQDEEITIDIPTNQIPHNTGVYLMVRVKDKVGLWSKETTSQRILIDHTAPFTPVLNCSQYTNSLNEIKEIEYQSSDPESRLISYRLGIVTEIGGNWLFSHEENTNQFNGKLTNLSLTETGVYYLAMQTQNGAGTWSEIGYSGPITVDTVNPIIGFTRFNEKIVINEPPLYLEYTLSENAQVRVIITGNDGIIYENTTIAGFIGINQYIFTQATPQEYIVRIIPTDAAGNMGLETEQTKQLIRVNAPPEVSLAGINATPGQPLQFQAIVTDPDGEPDDIFTYEWLPGDGGAALNEAEPEYRYTNLGEYTLTLTVTDKDGGKTSKSAPVTIGNTTGGTLYMNEVWSGIHRIYKDVTVPAGINLTIKPETQVIVDGAPGEGYFHSLIIKGDLIIEGSGVTFSSSQNEKGAWKGIRVEGQANIDGVEILNAARGLTVVNNATVAVTNSNFHDNHIGIHIYRANPVIQGTVFRDNDWYGIKEDGECHPLISNCTFTENEVDYYHDQLTAVTMEELNDIGENEGNSN